MTWCRYGKFFFDLKLPAKGASNKRSVSTKKTQNPSDRFFLKICLSNTKFSLFLVFKVCFYKKQQESSNKKHEKKNTTVQRHSGSRRKPPEAPRAKYKKQLREAFVKEAWLAWQLLGAVASPPGWGGAKWWIWRFQVWSEWCVRSLAKLPNFVWFFGVNFLFSDLTWEWFWEILSFQILLYHFPQMKWCFESTFLNKNSQLFFCILWRKQKTWSKQKMRKRRDTVWGYMIFLHLRGLAFRNIAWGISKL